MRRRPTQLTARFDGYVRVSSLVSWITATIANSTTEYLVNSNDVGFDPNTGNAITIDNQTNNQSHSSVAMDADGDYTIVWTSYGHDGGSGRRQLPAKTAFSASDTPPTARRRALSSRSIRPPRATSRIAHVAMDADGDFVVTWESSTDGTNYDIYARRYVSTATAEYQPNVTNPNLPLFMPFATNPLYGLNGENGGEFRVNSTTAGDQRYPSVGMDDTGDIIVVWSGQGSGDAARACSINASPS